MTTVLRLRERTLEIDAARPLVMGIVNASPESFSDGGRYPRPDDQLELARELVEAGADLIDVGGESGVTDRPAISVEEETRRVLPLVETLAAEGVLVSVDTWKPAVARAVVDAGASLINDVSGLLDPAVADACAASGTGLAIVHTRAKPKQKTFPGYDDPVADVLDLLRQRIALAVERGVEEERIAVDPGPDLAKTPAETVEVLRGLGALHELGRPIVLAVSRKDFVGALTGRSPRERLAGTLAAIGEGLGTGAAVLRVHDVREVADFVRVRAALRGEANVPDDLRLAHELRREHST